MKITINIEGPGKIINIPLEIIKRALKVYGYNVVINNKQPADYNEIGCSFKNVDEHLEYLKNLENRDSTVEINMTHLPWGG